MSLYRLYRPKTFGDVVGQDHIVQTLEHAVKQDKIAHAYLFSGPRGTGKTSIARILARNILTKNAKNDAIISQIIKAIEEGNLVDLLEIDAASNTGIDNIRDLIEKIQFSPVAAAAKVYIIDEVHMLSKGAFNALLKTLEEPPPYAYFILATTELHKIPATIQSRCQRFAFHHIREEDIIRHLQCIADQERISVDRDALRAMAHHVQGGMRDAVALLDQLRSLPKITLSDVKDCIGEGGHEYIEEIFRALKLGDTGYIMEIVQKMERAGVPMEHLLRHMLGNIRGELHEAIRSQIPIDPLLRTIDILLESLRDFRLAPLPGLVLESTLLRLHEKSLFSEKKPSFSKQTDSSPIPTPFPPVSPIPDITKKAAIVSAPPLTIETIRSYWDEVIRSTPSPSIKISLKNGTVVGMQGTEITVSFPSAFHRDKVASLNASLAIEKVLHTIVKHPLRLRCILESEEWPLPPSSDPEAVNIAEAAQEVFSA